MHIHGFSPEEVLYGSIRARCSIEEYLLGLKEAGVGSCPARRRRSSTRRCAT